MNKKPNIIFILTDDQGAWAMHCAGNGDVHTPNLDRIAAQGIRFNNFFCASPVCSPARASILTGTIPSCHGVQDWLSGGNLPADLKQIQGHPGYEKETIPSGKCTAGRQLGSVPAPDEKGGRKAEAAADESRRKKQEIKTKVREGSPPLLLF